MSNKRAMNKERYRLVDLYDDGWIEVIKFLEYEEKWKLGSTCMKFSRLMGNRFDIFRPIIYDLRRATKGFTRKINCENVQECFIHGNVRFLQILEIIKIALHLKVLKLFNIQYDSDVIGKRYIGMKRENLTIEWIDTHGCARGMRGPSVRSRFKEFVETNKFCKKILIKCDHHYLFLLDLILLPDLWI